MVLWSSTLHVFKTCTLSAKKEYDQFQAGIKINCAGNNWLLEVNKAELTSDFIKNCLFLKKFKEHFLIRV